MPSDPPIFCKRCYANLDQSTDSRCARCGRVFDASNKKTYYPQPFPSRWRIFGHLLTNLILATIVSAIIAFFLGIAQLKYLNSGH
jgi:hypothetical protein